VRQYPVLMPKVYNKSQYATEHTTIPHGYIFSGYVMNQHFGKPQQLLLGDSFMLTDIRVTQFME